MNSCFFIRANDKGILLDCGASVLPSLRKNGLSPDDVDVIIISHLHGDHYGGLPFLLCEISAKGRRATPLTIIGPPETESRTKRVLACFFPGVRFPARSQVRFLTYTKDSLFEHASITITAFAAIHTAATNPHMLRIAMDGKVIAYSGDTEWTDDIVELASGADLFICEASTYSARLRNHLSVKEIVDNASRIGAKRIVLTHLGDRSLQHAGMIPFQVAEDGAVLVTWP